jgi:flagellar protein FliJ
MKKKSPLSTLLRVRRLQEDVAKAEVAKAKMEAALADDAADAREQASLRSRPADGDPRAFVASMVASRALAVEAALMRRAAQEAHSHVHLRLADLSAAASKAEGVDRVVTRHHEEYAAHAAAADQAERDDLTGAAWQRRKDAEAARAATPPRQ